MWRLFSKKKIPSSQHGEITIERFFGRVVVRAGGVQQTGSKVDEIWRSALQRLEKAFGQPPRVLLLGLGAGGVVKELHTIFPGCTVTTVEHDPHMIAITRELRLYAPFPEPAIIEGDAGEVIAHHPDHFDLVLVDLYDGRVASPLVSHETFLRDIKHHLRPGGIMLMNIFSSEPERMRTAQEVFGTYAHWPHAANTIGVFWDTPTPHANTVVKDDIL